MGVVQVYLDDQTKRPRVPKANLSSQIGDKQLYDKLKNGKSDYTRFGLRFLRDLPTVRLFGQKRRKTVGRNGHWTAIEGIKMIL